MRQSKIEEQKFQEQKQNKEIKEKKVGWLERLLGKFISMNQNSKFRSAFVVVCLVHVVMLSLPDRWTNFTIPVQPGADTLLNLLYEQWPVPTFQISGQDGQRIIFVRFLCKLFEIMAQVMYVFDLLPKIFNWKQPLMWRLVNLVVLLLIFIQVPLTLNFQQELLVHTQKLRLLSISVSFLLTCEIISLREERSNLLQKEHCYQPNNRKEQQKHQGKNVRLNLKSQRLKGVFSWAEIIKHDKREDCWVVIKGKVYDLTQFIPMHPGGDMILDGAGGECTPMWYSYHSSASLQRGPPHKYCIGQVHNYHDFYNYGQLDTQHDFYLSLKRAVEQIMSRAQFQNSGLLFLKALVILGGFLFTQYKFTTEYTLLWCILYSFFCSQVGVNVMHDGNHLGFSSNNRLSYWMGYALDWTGSSSVVYRRSHNFGHHGCVNHYELDRAFDTTYPLIRLHPHQPHQPFHSFQHIYVWFLYATVNFGDLLGTFDELQWMSNYPCRRGQTTKIQIYLQVIVKANWLLLNMLLPVYLHGFTAVYPLWLLYMAVFSYGYTLFFAVNHWTDLAGLTDNQNISQTEWGRLQVVNSTNFATNPDSWWDSFITQLSGGLNYQIEHHLFPYLPHTRYPSIQPLVKQHCEQAQLIYNSYPSFYQALKGHYRYLYNLSH